MNNWDSYMNDPFFSEQDYDGEQRIDDEMERVDNNFPPPEQMPIASNNIPPMAPMPVASNIAPPPTPMPTAFYPVMPMYCCPPIHWCHPVAGGIPHVMHGDIDSSDMSSDMAPQAMPIGTEEMPNMAAAPISDDHISAPMQDGEMAVPYTGQMPGTVSGMASPAAPAPAPMFPTTGMAPAVSFPMYGPMMPYGAMPYYGPTSYYGGMAPYSPFFPVPYMPYR
jgi:hypothetical protein